MPNKLEHILIATFSTRAELDKFKRCVARSKSEFSFCSLFRIINPSAPDCYSSKLILEDEIELKLMYSYVTSWYPLFDYYLTMASLFSTTIFDIRYTDELYLENTDPKMFSFTLGCNNKIKPIINNIQQKSNIYPLITINDDIDTRKTVSVTKVNSFSEHFSDDESDNENENESDDESEIDEMKHINYLKSISMKESADNACGKYVEHLHNYGWPLEQYAIDLILS